MRLILIPLALALLGLGAGVGAGLMLGPEASEAGKTAEVKPDETHEAPAATDPSEVEYARLSNQFIVPVVADDEVTALVVLSLTLEVRPGGTEAVFQSEPRLRDRFLRVLFDHANVGGFDSGFTEAGTMTLLRNGLREAASEILGPVVRDVLIVDIVRQEV